MRKDTEFISERCTRRVDNESELFLGGSHKGLKSERRSVGKRQEEEETSENHTEEEQVRISGLLNAL